MLSVTMEVDMKEAREDTVVMGSVRSQMEAEQSGEDVTVRRKEEDVVSGVERTQEEDVMSGVLRRQEEDVMSGVVRRQEAALRKLEAKHGSGYGKPPPGSESEARARRYNENCMRSDKTLTNS